MDISCKVKEYKLTKSLKVRNEIIIDMMDNIKRVAAKLRYSKHEQGDLINEGVLGLIKACTNYEVEKNPEFVPYALLCIRGAMLNYLRNDVTIPRCYKTSVPGDLMSSPTPSCHSEIKKLSEQKNIAYEKAMYYALSGMSGQPTDMIIDSTNPADIAEKMEEYEKLNEKLIRLDARKSELINCRMIEERTFKELGEIFDISSQRAAQIMNDIYRELR